jgi:hypothetical protein
MPALDPPARGALWLNLALTKVQLAALCGVTVRQVAHWTTQGYLSPRPGSDRYNGNAVEQCLLIKQGRDAGLSPRRAVSASGAAGGRSRSGSSPRSGSPRRASGR